MGNYGFRISKAGIDVKTGSDKDMVITSKQSVLKGTISGNGTKSLTEGVVGTVTISHGLGYIPSVFFLVDVFGSGRFKPTPYYDAGELYEQWYYAYADSTNVYLKFFENYYGGGTVTTDYAYKIYIDKGKL